MLKIFIFIFSIVFSTILLSSYTKPQKQIQNTQKYHQFMFFSGGITGYSVAGCSCHGSANASVGISISGLPSAPIIGTTYSLLLNVTGTNPNAGYNLTVDNGALVAGDASSQLIGAELTHAGSKPLVSGATSFAFDWTPTVSGSATFSYAVNNINLNGNTGGDIVNNTTTSVTVQTLPIKLNKFVGNNINTSTNALQWLVDEETNFKQYDIEKSIDAINYQKIGIQLPTLNTIAKQYSFIDQSVSSTNSYKNYYRLKIVDLNGTFTYSPVVAIANTQKKTKALLFPNITTTQQPITVFTGSKLPSQILIYNELGKLIQNTNTISSFATIQFPNNAIAGKYFITIQNGITKTTLPLIIQ